MESETGVGVFPGVIEEEPDAAVDDDALLGGLDFLGVEAVGCGRGEAGDGAGAPEEVIDGAPDFLAEGGWWIAFHGAVSGGLDAGGWAEAGEKVEASHGRR